VARARGCAARSRVSGVADEGSFGTKGLPIEGGPGKPEGRTGRHHPESRRSFTRGPHRSFSSGGESERGIPRAAASFFGRSITRWAFSRSRRRRRFSRSSSSWRGFGRVGLPTATPALAHQRSLVPLPSPCGQVRRVEPFPPQESPDLTGFATGVGLLQDRELVIPGELPPKRPGGDLRVWTGRGDGQGRSRGKSPSATLRGTSLGKLPYSPGTPLLHGWTSMPSTLNPRRKGSHWRLARRGSSGRLRTQWRIAGKLITPQRCPVAFINRLIASV
jgi:hypothetical protein